MLEFKEIISHIIPMLPIIGAGVLDDATNDRNEGAKLSTASMISRVLELAILGGIFLYTTVQVMDSKIEVMETFVTKHGTEFQKIRDDVHILRSDISLLSYKLQEHQMKDRLRREMEDKANK